VTKTLSVFYQNHVMRNMKTWWFWKMKIYIWRT